MTTYHKVGRVFYVCLLVCLNMVKLTLYVSLKVGKILI